MGCGFIFLFICNDDYLKQSEKWIRMKLIKTISHVLSNIYYYVMGKNKRERDSSYRIVRVCVCGGGIFKEKRKYDHVL